MIFYVAIDAEGRRQIRGTQADARDVNKVFKQIDIPTDKAGLMATIQQLYDASMQRICDGVDTSDDIKVLDTNKEAEEGLVPEAITPPLSYSEHSVQIDEVFISLPIGHQLTLASIALENARECHRSS